MKWHIAGMAVGAIVLGSTAVAQKDAAPGRPTTDERPLVGGGALGWGGPKTDVDSELEVAPIAVPSGEECGLLSSITTPGMPGGAAFDGNHLWVSEFLTAKLHRLDPTTGELLQTILAPGPYVGGLAWDGTALWCLPEQSGTIYQLDPKDGTVLHSIPAPSKGQRDPNGSGLAWDGTALWHADYSSRQLYRLDPVDGTILAQHAAPARMPAGLAYHAGVLVLADPSSREFVMVQASDGTVLSSCSSTGNQPWGVAREPNGNIWITDFSSTADLMAGSARPWYENYCEATPNSTGAPATLSAEGSASISNNDLVLMVSNVPDGMGYFSYSRNRAHVARGAGFVCLGRPTFRTKVLKISGGTMSHAFDLSGNPAMGVGETWHFQAQFRDRTTRHFTFNASDGVTITFGH